MKRIIGKLLCRLGLHDWSELLLTFGEGKIYAAEQCGRCGKPRELKVIR